MTAHILKLSHTLHLLNKAHEDLIHQTDTKQYILVGYTLGRIEELGGALQQVSKLAVDEVRFKK